MRLFVALGIPEEVSTDLQRQLDPLRAGTGAELRWLPVEQWHLTLTFLGEVPAERVAELTTRLARAAARTAPLRLSVAAAGCFPTAGRAQVLWAGVAGDHAGLRRLAERTGAAARRTGVPVEARRWRPHLTVARSRQRPGSDLRAVLAVLASYAGPTWTAAEVLLLRSHLGRQVRYEQVGQWPLTGQPAEPQSPGRHRVGGARPGPAHQA